MLEKKRLSRNPSTESAEEMGVIGKLIKEKRLKKPKERWLLTRKTWRYMADAGKKLIPEGVHNRPEDIPKIEAYFQEMCRKEPSFLLWRKNSYPGALGFRSSKQMKDWWKSGSCRKASSADEIEQLKPERPKNLQIPNISGGRFDIQKMKYNFLNVVTPTSSPETSVKRITTEEDQEENQLIDMLGRFLSIFEEEQPAPSTSTLSTKQQDLNYQELFEKLQRHLKFTRHYYTPSQRSGVYFEGNHVHKNSTETLNRYFSQYTNRDKVISDLLTDRKALEKLYFDLRKTKGFRSRNLRPSESSSLIFSQLRLSSGSSKKLFAAIPPPPPLIEVQQETSALVPVFEDFGIQTDAVSEDYLIHLIEEYKENQEIEEASFARNFKSSRRRSSVDNDDVSQSVSDTIKRYLRMARKKSVDSKQADRFKRVNYDRNLRNIKAKGEITKPGDDDGMNKGCQTNDDWVLTFKNPEGEYLSSPLSDSSSRNSVVNDKGSTQNPVQTFFSNLLHHHHSPKLTQQPSQQHASSISPAMQKSKSSSSVSGRLMAKKIFRSRSKSQTRPAPTHASWTPQVGT